MNIQIVLIVQLVEKQKFIMRIVYVNGIQMGVNVKVWTLIQNRELILYMKHFLNVQILHQVIFKKNIVGQNQ